MDNIKTSYIFLSIISLMLIGQFFSFSLQSISFLLFCIFAMVSTEKQGFSLSPRSYIAAYKSAFVLLSSLLFLYVIIPSGGCHNTSEYLTRLMVKLPFLFLPAAIYIMPKIDLKILHKYLLMLGLIISGLILALVIVHLGDVSDYKVGKTFDTPGNHIKFSVIGAVIFMLLIILWERKQSFVKPTAFIALILLISLHILAVRTGLLLSYVVLAIGIWRGLRSTSKALSIVVMLVVLSMPFIAYKWIPSFQYKVDYMVWDINQFLEGKGGNYADSGRLASFDVGLEVWRQAPWLGAGCHLNENTASIFGQKYPEYPADLLPHNQFLFTLSHKGILGLILLLIGLFGPTLLEKRFRQSAIYYTLPFIVTWMMVDHPLEGTVGVGIYLLLITLGSYMGEDKLKV